MNGPATTDGPLESDAAQALEGLHDDVDFARTQASVLQRIFGGPREPTRVGRFDILGSVGDGAMGRVYTAYDPELDRTVALKLIRHAGLDKTDALQRQERLVREAKALAQLSHANVISVHEVGQWKGDAFIVMAYVPGPNLRQWIAARCPSTAERLAMLISAGRGLAAAHQAKLIHRDIKPENIVVAGPGHAVVLDFGVAVAADGPATTTLSDLGEGPDADVPEARLTQTGAAVGTPAYMAPEHQRLGIADERSDQYSFCLTLYEAITGDRPTVTPSGACTTTWPRSGAQLGRARQEAVERGLARDPNDRWPSVAALLDALEHDRRHTKKRAFAAGLVLTGLAGIYLAQRPTALLPCDAGESVTAVWNDERAAAVQDNLAGLDVPYAEHVSQRVVDGLGTWSEHWKQERVRACEDRRAQLSSVVMHDKWVRCLDRRAKEVDALVTAWTQSQTDPKVLTHALAAVRTLKSPELCGDSSWMAADVEPPPTAAHAAQVEQLRERLDTAAASMASGRFDEALGQARAVAAEARPLDYAPLLAEALFLLGRAHGLAGDWSAGEAPLLEAHLGAVASSHDQLAPEIATELVFFVGYYGGRADEGLAWARTAASEAQRLDGTWPGGARLLRNRAVVHNRRGEFALAIELLDKAIALNPAGRANYDLNRGHAFSDLGRYEDARSAYESALAVTRKDLGDAHPNVGRHLHSLGGLFDSKGDFEEAANYFRLAVDNRELSLGPDHPNTAQSRLMLGAAHYQLGNTEMALDLQRDAMRSVSRNLGAAHPQVAPFHSNLGNTLSALGRFEEAERHHRQALAIMVKEKGEDNPSLAIAYNNLGSVAMSREDFSGAVEHFTRGLVLREKAFGLDNPRLVFSLSGLGRSERELGHLARAAEHYARIIQLLGGGALHPTRLAKAHLGLAEIAWAEGRHAQARKHAQDAGAADSTDAQARAKAWLDAHPDSGG